MRASGLGFSWDICTLLDTRNLDPYKDLTRSPIIRHVCLRNKCRSYHRITEEFAITFIVISTNSTF